MAHAHIVSDSDNHFVIDPISRQLSNNSKKTILMKTDHNSEQFTFELPRMVEGHDMSLSNKVEVHYININSKTREQSTGIYNVADFGVDAEDDTKVLGTWLVSREATKYAGSLNFVIRFACLSADNVEEYAWNTAIYAGITIADTIENTETVVEDYVDILRQWLDTIENAGSSGKVYAITDDGTLIDLTEKINNFSTQVNETNTKFEELKTANDQFKEDINQRIADFEQAVDNNLSDMENKVTNVSDKYNEMSPVFQGLNNDYNIRMPKAEDDILKLMARTNFLDDSELLTGTVNDTVIGTSGRFYIEYYGMTGLLENSTISFIIHKPEPNSTVIGDQDASYGFKTIYAGIIPTNSSDGGKSLVILVYKFAIDTDGKLQISIIGIEFSTTSGYKGHTITDVASSTSQEISHTFKYKKIS